MKITKEYLKKIILEEINNELGDSEEVIERMSEIEMQLEYGLDEDEAEGVAQDCEEIGYSQISDAIRAGDFEQALNMVRGVLDQLNQPV